MSRAIFFALLFGGCAAPTWKWQPAAEVRRVADTVRVTKPSAPAIILDNESTAWTEKERRSSAIHWQEYFRRTLILSDAGRAYSSYRLEVKRDIDLQYIMARTIAADGTEYVVSPNDISRTTDGKTGAKTYTFKFPHADPGSVLEVASRTQQFGTIITGDIMRLTNELPIAHSRTSFYYSEFIDHEVRTHNTKVALTKTRRDSLDGVTLELNDLPAQSKLALAPPWQDVEPWVAFRVTVLRTGALYQEFSSTWDHAMDLMAETDYVTLVKGAKLPNVAAQCADRHDQKCALDAALAFIRTMRFAGYRNRSLDRPLKDVIASGEADNFERAILFCALLHDAGVKASLAAVSRNAGGRFVHDFPIAHGFDHLLVYLPRGATSQAVFIDPSCDFCAPGSLPMFQGKEALVFDWVSDGAKTSFHPVAGDFIKPTVQQTFALKLGEDGSMSGDYALEQTGTFAIDAAFNARGWTEQKWLLTRQQGVQTLGGNVQLTALTSHTCDKGEGHCRVDHQLDLPHYAVLADSKLTLPLTLLDLQAGKELVKEPTADRPLNIDLDSETTRTIDIELPAGWKLDALPSPVEKQSPLVNVSIAWKRDGQHVIATIKQSRVRGQTQTREEYAAVAAAFTALATAAKDSLVLHR